MISPAAVVVLYVHVPHDQAHVDNAHRFVASMVTHPAGIEHDMVVICNGSVPTETTFKMFSPLNVSEYFQHSDAGWDIGAYQAYCQKSNAKMIVFLGGSSYCRRPNWLARMWEVFDYHGERNLYGSMGNTGDMKFNIYPHVRTTGFWCSPELMNAYPMRVTNPQQRYPFEHGPGCLTQWAINSGRRVFAADLGGVWPYPGLSDSPEGFHRGTQDWLLMGDRLTLPPFYAHG